MVGNEILVESSYINVMDNYVLYVVILEVYFIGLVIV